MRKLSVALTAATALVAGVSLFEGSTQATVVADSSRILAGAETLNPVQNTQVYMWEGRRHCWSTTAVGMGPAGTGAVMLGAVDWVGAAATAGTAGAADIWVGSFGVKSVERSDTSVAKIGVIRTPSRFRELGGKILKRGAKQPLAIAFAVRR